MAMNKHPHIPVWLFIFISLFSACTLFPSSHLTLEDFSFLERGMNYEQVVERLDEPQDSIVGSSAFVTYVYKLETGDPVYLGFYSQADYLDSAYTYLHTIDGDVFTSLVPTSLDLPSGLHRALALSDFEGIIAGMDFFPDIYRQVGPPNISALFEGGDVSLVYYLNDGGRIAMITHGGYGCISLISYSPESFGLNWTTLSEDTEGKCGGE